MTSCSASPQRVFGNSQPAGGKTIFEADNKPTTAKELPATFPGVGRRLWPALAGVEAVDKYTVRFHNVTPDVTLEGRLYAFGSQIANRRAWDEAPSYLDWARKPITTGAYGRRVQARRIPDAAGLRPVLGRPPSARANPLRRSA